ncbi:MAG TPA: urease accessory protein UreD [Chloroflexota bacterium]
MDGARGTLEARFERRGRTTELASLGWRPPLQALRVLYPRGHDRAAELVVTTLGPGLLGGDATRVRVVLGPGAHARVTTTGATRVMPARSGRPTIAAAELSVEAGGLLEWLPRPTIAQAGAAYRQTTRLELAPGAAALLAEVLVPGRLAAGELFAFAELDVALEVCRGDGAPLLTERLRLVPAERDPRALGWLPGANVVLASLFVLAPGRDLDALADRIAATLPGQAGVTALPNGAGWLVRALSRSATAAESALGPALALAGEALTPDVTHRPDRASVGAWSGAGGRAPSVG